MSPLTTVAGLLLVAALAPAQAARLEPAGAAASQPSAAKPHGRNPPTPHGRNPPTQAAPPACDTPRPNPHVACTDALKPRERRTGANAR